MIRRKTLASARTAHGEPTGVVAVLALIGRLPRGTMGFKGTAGFGGAGPRHFALGSPAAQFGCANPCRPPPLARLETDAFV